LEAVAGVSRVTWEGGEAVVHGRGPILARVGGALAEHEIHPHDLRAEQPSLEDVFLALTGKQLRD
jgi:ABC-2 type transport system ATP-binding protein